MSSIVVSFQDGRLGRSDRGPQSDLRVEVGPSGDRDEAICDAVFAAARKRLGSRGIDVWLHSATHGYVAVGGFRIVAQFNVGSVAS